MSGSLMYTNILSALNTITDAVSYKWTHSEHFFHPFILLTVQMIN